MPSIDFERTVAITGEIHWIGFYDEEADLQCNPYLLVDREEAVLIDPGSIPHFPIVMRKIIDLIGPEEISTIVVSHQDPDVCGNLPVIEGVIDRPDLRIVAHGATIRLLRHYGIHSTFYPVDRQDYTLQLKSGRRLEFLFTPFLHAPGAIATYDPQSKSLFSADIFGAVSRNWSLRAQEDILPAMSLWHQAYMPSQSILAAFLDRIERLEIERILPQHGSVLEGPMVKRAIEHLRSLRCGLDLAGSSV